MATSETKYLGPADGGQVFVNVDPEAIRRGEFPDPPPPEPEQIGVLLWMLRLNRPVNRKDLAQHWQTEPGRHPRPKKQQGQLRDTAQKMLCRLVKYGWAGRHPRDVNRFIISEAGLKALESHTMRAAKTLISATKGPGQV